MSTTPPINYDDNRRLRHARSLLALLGLLLLALLAGDWFMRFYWFRWQDVFRRPVEVNTPAAGFTTRVVPPRRGSDLSNFIPSALMRKRFEDEHPGGVISYDPAGYENLPYASGSTFDIVVVGDSYMVAGMPQTNQISAQLAQLLGVPVLNRAVAGRGPFQSLRYLVQEIGRGMAKPKLIVWGFIEREISGPSFVGFVYQLEKMADPDWQDERVASSYNPWHHLAPAALRVSLPNSSALAQLSQKIWSFIQFNVAGRLPPEVIILEGKGSAKPLLGYGDALNSMYWPPEVRRIDQAVYAVCYIRDYLEKLGIQLLVLPIHDKEQVYRDLIAPSDWRNGVPPPPSIIPSFASQLEEQGISCIDLSSAFGEARRRGVALYWRDDTHWNENGIRLAAEEIARSLSTLRAH